MTRFAAFAAVALCAAPAVAHDLWIAPSTFHPAPGEVVRVHLRVGDQPVSAEPVIRDPERLLRLSAFEAAGGETPVPGFDGQDPAGLWKATVAGPAILIYESAPRPIELPAERFEHYLVEEGLEPLVAERARRGESATAGRELYSRSVKALVQVGQVGEGPLRDRAVGLPFEIVLDASAPDRLAARLLWHGRPAPGALVEAIALDGESVRLATRSDREGRVSFALPRGGRWLLATVHMERLEPGQNAEWRSTWASLAFEQTGSGESSAGTETGRDAEAGRDR